MSVWIKFFWSSKTYLYTLRGGAIRGGKNFEGTDDTAALQLRVGGGYARPHIIYIFLGGACMDIYMLRGEETLNLNFPINYFLKSLDITL